jgi:hypothetical protein
MRRSCTSWHVGSSIPGGVIGIFHCRHPSCHTIPLRSTQSLIELSTRNISWGAGRGVANRRAIHRADNLNTFVCRLAWPLRASSSCNPQGRSRSVMGLLFLCTLSNLHCLLIVYSTKDNIRLCRLDFYNISRYHQAGNLTAEGDSIWTALF